MHFMYQGKELCNFSPWETKSAFLGQKVKQAWHSTGFAGFAAAEDMGCQDPHSMMRFA